MCNYVFITPGVACSGPCQSGGAGQRKPGAASGGAATAGEAAAAQGEASAGKGSPLGIATSRVVGAEDAIAHAQDEASAGK